MTPRRFDTIARRLGGRPLTRRAVLGSGAAALAAGMPGNPMRMHATPDTATPLPGNASDPADAIIALAERVKHANGLRAVILKVTIGGETFVTAALGESMTGVPATPDMRFRNGAVAISYMATLLLQLSDRGIAGLDDPIWRWMPDVPDAGTVTLRMLANMTAGYPDYVRDAGFEAANYADPFRAWSPEELIAIGVSAPRRFAPGTNWDYSHTNYVILGRVLERIADAPLGTLLQGNVLDPLTLTGTIGSATPAIPGPVLHAFTSERRQFLGIDPDVRFYEDSTFWNPSWTLAEGAIQTTTIHDMAATAEAIGTGMLLSPASHRAQIAPDLLGFGSLLDGCPNCHTLTEAYSYGLGVVLAGRWILQNPLFGGYGAIEAYLPGEQVAIAVATTFGENGFDDEGNNLHPRSAWEIFASIAAVLAPSNSLPERE